ncbi:MAG: DUF2079 domain-containing protein [Anaerolineae bacterium]|nr:DUF2079 domain-containing protein [Anaerolineae bacterium]
MLHVWRNTSCGWSGALVALLIIAYTVFFSAITIARHNGLETNAYDLGNVDQAVWNTAHGRPLAFTNWEGRAKTFKAGTRLAMHVEPIYFLIAPLYWIWSDPRALLILQTVILALGALPAYWLARNRLGDGLPAVVFPTAYLLFPALEAANLFDFHAVTLAASLLLFAAYGLLCGRTRWFLAFGLLAAATKEEIPLLVAMMGLYAAAIQRRPRLGIPVALAGITWFLIAVFVIVPAFNTSGRSPYLNYYGSVIQLFGDSAGQDNTVISIALGKLLTEGNLRYMVRLLAPVGWLSLFSPATLVMLLPSLLINLISDNAQMHYLERYHYAAPLVPFVIVSGIMGTAWISHQLGTGRLHFSSPYGSSPFPFTDQDQVPLMRRIAMVLSLWVLTCTLAYHYHRGFTPLAEGFTWPEVSEHDRRLQDIARLIPSNASLSTQSNLNPHFSQRDRINLFPYSLNTEYLLLDAATFTANKDNFLTWMRDHVVGGSEFGVIAAEDGYILLQRGAPPRPLPDAFYSFLRANDAVPEYPLNAEFARPDTGEGVLRLHGYDIEGRRGDERVYTLYFEALRSLSTDYQIALFELNANGDVVGATTEPPAALVWYPTQRWQPGEVIRVVFNPVTWWTQDTPEFGVAVGVYEGDEVWDLGRRLRPRVLESPWQVRLPGERTLLQLATLRNRWRGPAEEVPARLFTPPHVPQQVDMDFGGQVRLLGYDAGPTVVRPGEELHVRLYWRARAPIAESYTVFVHLLDANHQVRGQRDGLPGGGLRPTYTWAFGEVVVDEVRLVVAPEASPGPHQLEVGMYLTASGTRLPVTDAAGNPQGDRVLLPQIITVQTR